MAEGWLRHFAGDKAVIYSAGVEPEEVNPKAIKVMREAEIDISSHTSDHVNKYLDKEFDYIITVCDNAREKCPYIAGDSVRIHRNFPDPAPPRPSPKGRESQRAINPLNPSRVKRSEEEIIDEYRKVRDMIEGYCREFVEEMLK